MASLKLYDGTEIFENRYAPKKKAYLTATPVATDGHLEPQVFDTAVYLGENAGELVATTFKGSLSGNADSATHIGSSSTTIGSVDTPVYIKNGIPKECNEVTTETWTFTLSNGSTVTKNMVVK